MTQFANSNETFLQKKKPPGFPRGVRLLPFARPNYGTGTIGEQALPERVPFITLAVLTE